VPQSNPKFCTEAPSPLRAVKPVPVANARLRAVGSSTSGCFLIKHHYRGARWPWQEVLRALPDQALVSWRGRAGCPMACRQLQAPFPRGKWHCSAADDATGPWFVTCCCQTASSPKKQAVSLQALLTNGKIHHLCRARHGDLRTPHDPLMPSALAG